MLRRRSASRRNRQVAVQAVESLETRQVLAAFPVGAAIVVNHHEDTASHATVVATEHNGGFISAWRDNFLDGDGGGIYARRFGSNGSPLGSAFRVNDVTTNDQTLPVVTTFGKSRIAFAWVTYDGEHHTEFRRFDGTGAPLANAVRLMDGGWDAVQPNLVNGAYYPRDLHVSTDASGNTVVISAAWDHRTSTYGPYLVKRLNRSGATTVNFSLDLMQRYKAEPVNDQSQKWDFSSGKYYADFAVTPAGEIVAVYELFRQRFIPDVGYRYDNRVLLRRFSAEGVRLNDRVLFNKTFTDAYDRSSGANRVSITPDGNIAVAWHNGKHDLVYRVFDPSGTAVNNSRVLIKRLVTECDMQVLENGNVVTAWLESVPRGWDRIWVREFDSNGVPVGPAALIDEESEYAGKISLSAASIDHAFVTWDRTDAVNGPTNVLVRKIGLGNAPPTLQGAGGAYYRASRSAVEITPQIVVQDSDSAHLNLHQIQIAISEGGHWSNRLTFQGSGITIGDGKVSVDGVVVGTIAADAGVGRNPLTINLNNRATVSKTQRVLRSLVFSTTSRASLKKRIVEVSIIDPEGIRSLPLSVEIEVF